MFPQVELVVMRASLFGVDSLLMYVSQTNKCAQEEVLLKATFSKGNLSPNGLSVPKYIHILAHN